MSIYFEQIEKKYVKRFFNSFFGENGIYFEIIAHSIPIGFYEIYQITDKLCEISVFFSESGRWKITKKVVLKCLSFPFFLGFDKIIIRTKLKNMYRFLCKMTRYGVNYLFEQNETYWFEVLKWEEQSQE